MARKIDPLNRKKYGAVNVSLTVTDMKAAMSFYKKAFGFEKRGVMNGPGGKPIHAELALRGTILMLGPEMPGWNKSAKTMGGSPSTLYLYVENAEQGVCKGVEAGGHPEDAGEGHVLGRPQRFVDRPRGVPVVCGHAHRRTHTAGNGEEDEGGDGDDDAAGLNCGFRSFR